MVLVFSLAAQTIFGGLVFDSNVTLTHFPSSGPEQSYSLAVSQDEERTDYTSIWFDVNDTVLSVVGYNVDEGSDWFLASYGDFFSALTIANGDFSCVLQHHPELEVNSVDIGYGDFYLGLNTGIDNGGDGPHRDVYGWVHLDNSGGLSMHGNAVAYGSQGVFVGVVPEPSTYILFALGGLTMAIAARRRMRKKE